MTIEERVLTALRCEQPDRVPVFTFLNPHVESWQTEDPSYREVLDACRRYADVVYDYYFPSGLIYTAAEPARETRDLGDGRIEWILHTPAGPLTSSGSRRSASTG
ncbi:MAG: hypothetical protein WDA75_04805 [Candidatus Latescibacterota bacterium]|jgi:hypothetical protein